MECELCPIKWECPAYKEALADNDNSYHPQNIVRVSDFSEPGCPLVELIKQMPKKRSK